MGLFEEHRALYKLLGTHLSLSLLGEGDEEGNLKQYNEFWHH